jgi:hypothetical protein
MKERKLTQAKKISTRVLRQRRRAALRQLPDLQEILRGSLMERYLTCGKPGCKCARGERHGPVWYLSVTLKAGKTVGRQVPVEQLEPVRGWLENYRHLKESLETICEINWELVRRGR